MLSVGGKPLFQMLQNLRGRREITLMYVKSEIGKKRVEMYVRAKRFSSLVSKIKIIQCEEVLLFIHSFVQFIWPPISLLCDSRQLTKKHFLKKRFNILSNTFNKAALF